MLPWGGLSCCLSAAVLYLLGRRSGRDADALKSVTRVGQLKDLGVMDSRGTQGGHLFQGMKRRKRVAKRTHVEVPQDAEPEVPGYQPEDPPRGPEMIPSMQEPAGGPYAETTYIGAPTYSGAPAYSRSAHTRAGPSGSGALGDFRSVLTPTHALQKSKEAIFPEEVATWTDLPLHQVACRAVTHAMVVNSSIHALAAQVERSSRQARVAEEARRAAEEAARAAEEAARFSQIRQARSQRDAEAMGVVVKHMADLRLDLQHQVEYLQEDIKERTQIFSQGIGDAKKAVEEYIASPGFDDLMVDSYRRGFKLSQWMIWNTYPELDVSAISTSRITQERANAADAEPDSEDEAGPSGFVEVPFDDDEIAPGL